MTSVTTPKQPSPTLIKQSRQIGRQRSGDVFEIKEMVDEGTVEYGQFRYSSNIRGVDV